MTNGYNIGDGNAVNVETLQSRLLSAINAADETKATVERMRTVQHMIEMVISNVPAQYFPDGFAEGQMLREIPDMLGMYLRDAEQLAGETQTAVQRVHDAVK